MVYSIDHSILGHLNTVTGYKITKKYPDKSPVVGTSFCPSENFIDHMALKVYVVES